MCFQNLLGPLLDVPTKDAATTTFLGGELLVVALLYVFIVRDLDRYRGLLWIVALDQFCAAMLPAVEIGRGYVAMTLKTVGPIPFSLALAVVFALGARDARTGSSRPETLEPHSN